MCTPMIAGLFTGGAGAAAGAATAAGATAGAATIGGIAQTVGTVLGIGGSIAQGIAGARAAKASAASIEDQKAAEARMTATEDRRTRALHRSAMRRQTAELAARGVALDSPTAILLGQAAGAELSYASQGVRQGGAAKQTDLSNEQRALRARGTLSWLSGVTSAADTLFTAAPRLWPELSA